MASPESESFRLERTQRIACPRAEVFAFFADPANLERITPAFLRFAILTPLPVRMRAGLLIDYRLRLFGLPMSWRTEITAYNPPYDFVDEQLIGPYAHWRHVHRFEETNGVTEMVDRVDYSLPLGPLGNLAHTILVVRTLRQIFDFRQHAIARHFTSPPA